MIVTFKDLYLGFGDDFVVGEVRQQLEDFIKADGHAAVDDWNRVLLISIDELELLLSNARDGSIDLAATLRQVVEDQRTVSTRKMQVKQFSGLRRGYPRILEDAFETTSRGVLQRAGLRGPELEAELQRLPTLASK